MARDINDERYIITYSDISQCLLITDITYREEGQDQEIIDYSHKTPKARSKFVYKKPGLLDLKIENLKLVCSFNDGVIVIIDVPSS